MHGRFASRRVCHVPAPSSELTLVASVISHPHRARSTTIKRMLVIGCSDQMNAGGEYATSAPAMTWLFGVEYHGKFDVMDGLSFLESNTGPWPHVGISSPHVLLSSSVLAIDYSQSEGLIY